MGYGIEYDTHILNIPVNPAYFHYFLEFKNTTGSFFEYQSDSWFSAFFLQEGTSYTLLPGTQSMAYYVQFNDATPWPFSGFSYKAGAAEGSDNWAHYVSNGQYVWAKFTMPNNQAGRIACDGYVFSTAGDFTLNEAIAAMSDGTIDYWQGATGIWDTGSNWILGTPATAGTKAAINNGGTARVAASMNTVVPSLQLGSSSGNSGHLEVSNGGTFRAGDIYIGRAGVGTLSVATGSTVTATSTMFLGTQAGATGSANVSGTGTELHADMLRVGQSGIGTINVTNGGKLATDRGYVGEDASGVGIVTVSGSGSEWHDYMELVAGYSGQGSVTVTNGGKLTTNGSMRLGQVAGSHGEVIITGSGSQAQFMNTLAVGKGGFGKLSILDGAQATAEGYPQSFVIGEAASSVGEVLISGLHSKLTSKNDVTVGQAGWGTITLQEDGILDAPGILLATENNGSGTLNFGSSDLAHPTSAGSTTASTVTFSSKGGATSTVNFNQTNDITVSTVMKGDKGAINKRGLGRTILTGNSQNFKGQTTVSKGTLIVDGTLYGDIYVKDRAQLSGTGVLENVLISNEGTIKPGEGGDSDVGLLRIDGTLTMETNQISSIWFNINGRGEGEYSQLSVNKWANTENRNLLLIYIYMNYLPQIGDSFQIFTDAMYTGEFAMMEFNPPNGLPSQYRWDTSKLAAEGVIMVASSDSIPEPGTSLLMGLGVVALCFFRGRARRK